MHWPRFEPGNSWNIRRSATFNTKKMSQDGSPKVRTKKLHERGRRSAHSSKEISFKISSTKCRTWNLEDKSKAPPRKAQLVFPTEHYLPNLSPHFDTAKQHFGATKGVMMRTLTRQGATRSAHLTRPRAQFKNPTKL